MTACAICAATGHLILTRQGLRCGACLRGEAEEARTWMEAYKAIVVDLAALPDWDYEPAQVRELVRRAIEATKP